jgi:aerobic-type carbon monoxide dehydrogenase small subunit (CoxS/CutS family)
MKTPLTLTVNGIAYEVEVEPERSLLMALREDVGLTGTKEGCDDSECGACMMLLDGRSTPAPTSPSRRAGGR